MEEGEPVSAQLSVETSVVRKCEITGCPRAQVCNHYCAKHHVAICTNGERPIDQNKPRGVAIRQKFENGKYDVIFTERGELSALRNGEPWVEMIGNKLVLAMLQEVDRLRAPIPMVLHCPHCRAQHVDEGEWATEPHRTHLCAECDCEFRPANVHTVGVKKLPE